MEGYCKFCGQAHLVAETRQEEADRIATDICDCENEQKKIRKIQETVKSLCGTEAAGRGFEPLTDEVQEEILSLCMMVHGEAISEAKIAVGGTQITIKGDAKKVSVARKRSYQQKLEA